MLLFSCWVMSDSFATPWTVSIRLLCPWDFPGKNTREGCHFLSRESSWPRCWTHVSCVAGGFFYRWATRESWWLNGEIVNSFSPKVRSKTEMFSILISIQYCTGLLSQCNRTKKTKVIIIRNFWNVIFWRYMMWLCTYNIQKKLIM